MYRALATALKPKRDDDDGPPGAAVSSLSQPSALDRAPSAEHRTISDFSLLPPASFVNRTKSPNRHAEPLGLRVLYKPHHDRTADLIFVHGLGGSSLTTLAWKGDPTRLWPQEWLPQEPEVKAARVLTFGYNANYLSQDRNTFNISDFAKDLLLQMKFGTDSDTQSLGIGEKPVIFIVHSMGGLVVKKAYILGAVDAEFKDLVQSVRSIVFLATPHRGSGLAEVLSKLLSISSHSPKDYIGDLIRNSPPISDINEQFRTYAGKLRIVSFFETHPTLIGLKKVMVVERDSATLGYPGEITSPLNTDHRNICKYKSRDDESYKTVRNVILALVKTFKSEDRKSHEDSALVAKASSSALDEIFMRLSVPRWSNSDVEELLEDYVLGSCDWILEDVVFAAFASDKRMLPTIIQVTGSPGSGKSVLSSFLGRHLRESGHPTQLWFFKYDDHLLRSTRQCILSLIYQMMEDDAEYAERLRFLSCDFESELRSDVHTIWQRFFVNIFSHLERKNPIYWVIDGIDEAESVPTFVGLLTSLKTAKFPLRIILLSRPHLISRVHDKLRAPLSGRLSHLPLETPKPSLELYVVEQLQWSVWPDAFKSSISTSLLEKTQGNFLWLSIVLKDLINCDTAEEVRSAINETPLELMNMYAQMEQHHLQGLGTGDSRRGESERRRIKAILAWVACVESPLSLDALAEALSPEFQDILNLKYTIKRLCGDFVVIDKRNTVTIVHHTAKEFLTKESTSILRVQSDISNQTVFEKCLEILSGSQFRVLLKSQGGVGGLLRYSCLFWSYHLVCSDELTLRANVLKRVADFFRSKACLSWIHAVASTGRIGALVVTAKDLNSYLNRYRVANASDNPLSQPLKEIEFIGNMATELVRIVGKFGVHLFRYPTSIYSVVPLFCPPLSIFGQYFSAPSTNPAWPKISGLSATTWDDSLAKLPLGHGQRPKRVYCRGGHFAILSSDKAVRLYQSSTFQEQHRFTHNEFLLVAQFNREGDKLVTCGIRTIKVWEIRSGANSAEFPNPSGVRATDVCFSNDSSEIIVYCADATMWRQFISEAEEWRLVDGESLGEPGRPGEGHRGNPICTCFSPDGSQIAVSYKGTSIESRSTGTGLLIGRSKIVGGRDGRWEESFGHATRLAWNPATEHVVGINQNGIIFKWYPLDLERLEMDKSPIAAEIACSPNGKFIVSGQRDGSLKVFAFDNFSILYSLTCASPPAALAVSSDGRRIYDLRRSFCNVWEPNALTRMAEEDEKTSDTPSALNKTSVNMLLDASEDTTSSKDPVSALVGAGVGEAYAFGSNSGNLTYVPGSGAEPVIASCGSLDIISMSMDISGSIVAVATLDKAISVYQFEVSDGGNVGLLRSFFRRSTHPIRQIVVSGNGSFLVAQYETVSEVFSIVEGTTVASYPISSESSRWARDPSNPTAFLCANESQILLCDALGELPDLPN